RRRHRSHRHITGGTSPATTGTTTTKAPQPPRLRGLTAPPHVRRQCRLHRNFQRRATPGRIPRHRRRHRRPHPAPARRPGPAAAPDVRAAWHQALAALGPVGGPDVRGMPDGRLLHLRDTYPIETAWAPPYVGDELRQVRAAAWDARLVGLRAAAEARAAGHRG